MCSVTSIKHRSINRPVHREQTPADEDHAIQLKDVTCSWTVAEMIILFLRSPILNMKVGRPFRGAMTAFLEKMSVSARRLAWAVFMKTQPSITALMMSPKMFWMISTVMATGHSSVTILPPKPMVTWSGQRSELEDDKRLHLDQSGTLTTTSPGLRWRRGRRR